MVAFFLRAGYTTTAGASLVRSRFELLPTAGASPLSTETFYRPRFELYSLGFIQVAQF
jgi:hypothetical protein